MNLDFKRFNTGTLFLVRTPEVFPEGYAEKSFEDMKNKFHFDFAALLETWNCQDGVLWKSDKYPRSSYWKNENRDPVEECFLAADKYDMAFLPEAGMMDEAFMREHEDGMRTKFDGRTGRYGRIGLSPSCPQTLEYLVDKYDTMLGKFSHHPSCRGVCLPCENSIELTYDKYTRAQYRKEFGEDMPSPEEIGLSKSLEIQVYSFLEDRFLKMYRALASHIKKKYSLPLMHYPLDVISAGSFMHPACVLQGRNISVMTRARELDLLNLQLHPPLYPNPYYFKLEAEYLQANSDGIPSMADTHFYHEMSAGRVPDMTPKRTVDSILSTLTPNGISFFCYGFMAQELPLWKKELNPGAPVFKAYSEANTVKARREMCLKAMDYVEVLRPLMEGSSHIADCGIYFPEDLNNDYLYSSYSTEHIFGLHELCNSTAIPTKLISKIPDSCQSLKAIIMDSVKSIPKDDLKRLGDYIKLGGKVLVVGRCCEEIEKALGIESVLSDGEFVVSDSSRNYNHSYFRIPLDGKHYTEKNGEALLCYGNGEAVVTRRGNVIFFGASDAVGRFGAYRDLYLSEYWKKLFNDEGLNCGVYFNNLYVNRKDGHQFTSCDLYGNENKLLLLVRNFGVEHYHARLEWKLPEEMEIVKSFCDGESFEFENSAELPVFEHFVAIYAERKNQNVR